ncbi:MAG: putative toxin-antitoxin system toxin component, PIN family [Tepidisphaeraceae bacterium]
MSIRVVYDTMLFVQAAARPDRIHTTFRALLDGRVILCVSPALVAEITDVLARPAVRARFPALSDHVVEVFLADVQLRATTFDSIPAAFTWPQHPDDDHIFNLAIHAKATRLVTWETRILNLASETTPAADLLRQIAPDLRIVTPKMLAEELSQR